MSLGSVDVSLSPLLCLRVRQFRRDECGLVTPNERGATTSGALSGTTRRAGRRSAGAIFPPGVVIPKALVALAGQALSHLFGISKPHSFCLARRKNGLQQW